MMNKKPDITDIIESVNQKENGNNQNNNIENLEALKALEIGKIIVQETLKPDNVKSLTFLNPEQIDDITKAKLLNSFYNISEIDNYINDFVELKRSENGQLIRLFSQMAMFNHDNDERYNQKGFFSRILKR